MIHRYRVHRTSEWGLAIATRALPAGAQRALKSVRDACAIIRKEGLHCYAQLGRIAKTTGHNSEHTLQFRTLKFPFTLRAGSSDCGEFVATVMTDVLLPFLPEKADLVVDAGAFIGDSTCWYLTRFPEAVVVAVESDASNFSILERNVRPYGSRCVPLKGAVWPWPARLRALGPSPDTLSVHEVDDDQAYDCDAFTIPDILRKVGSNRIDVLKCNIEGAEEQLFSHGADEWLRRTSLVYVQVHNGRARAAVLSAAERNGFCCYVHRGFHILRAASGV